MTVAPGPVELDIALDRSSPVPLYHQLATALETAISDGRLVPGDRLENELSMTTRLGLARPTARQAIGDLVRKGMLVRKRGVGTQVVAAPIRRDVKLTSLYDDLEQAGRTPTTEVLELRPATETEADIEELPALDEPLVHVRRLRLAGGEALALMTNLVPARHDITVSELSDRGLYATLRARGIGFRIAHQTIGARLLTDQEAALLGEVAPAACVTMERVVLDDRGAFVELGRHVYRASHYTVQVSLSV